MPRTSSRDRDAASAQFPDHQGLLEVGAATITHTTRSPKRLVCWIAGGHTWPAWHAGASGWPMRTCTCCGARQVRLDASW